MRNFLSIGNNTQTINLAKDPLTLVLGENNDKGGRNGVGKTAAGQALSYGLFGKPLTKIKQTNLCNNVNKKNMVVTIEFDRDGISYRIERGQKPAFMRLFVDNAEQKADDEAQGENKKTQERIDALLGMSHTLFRHIVALNTFTDPFLRMSVGDQRTVIEELLGVTQISERAETLRDLIATTKERMREQEAIIRTTVEANDRITKTIISTECQFETWNQTHAKTIASLEEQIIALETIDFDAEIALFEKLDLFIAQNRDLTHNMNMAIQDLTRAQQEHSDHLRRLSRLQEDKLGSDLSTSLSVEIGRKEKALARYLRNIPKLQSDLDAILIEQQNADSSDCVCCGQPLSGTDHLATVVANINSRVRSAENELLRETREYDALLNEIDGLRVAIAEALVDEANTKTHKEAEITLQAVEVENAAKIVSEKKAAVDTAKTDCTAIGDRPLPTFGSRDELYSAKQICETLARDHEMEIAKINPYREQIVALRSTMSEVSYDLLNDLENLYKHQDFLLKLLVSKDSFIRKHIVDQNIHFINSRLEHYLEKLGLPHSVKFQSDLSVDITLLGIDMDFEQLSRGEMNRVILSTSWAFRDVWESLNTPINLFFIDELLDNGLCQLGVEDAVSVLKHFSRNNRNVFLISHREDLISSFENIMTVTKSDGFTVFGN